MSLLGPVFKFVSDCLKNHMTDLGYAVKNHQHCHTSGYDSLCWVQYDGSPVSPCECSLKRTHKSLQSLISENYDWLFRVWSMKALTVDGSKWYAFSIDKHSLGGKKVYLLDCMKHFRLSGNGTVILPLPDKNRPPLSSFLPAIFCHIKKGYKFSKVATLFLK